MGVGRVIEMNNALAYLPCLKHKEGAPTAMTIMNVKYTEIELCTFVLMQLPFTRQQRSTPPCKTSTDITKLIFTVDQDLRPEQGAQKVA